MSLGTFTDERYCLAPPESWPLGRGRIFKVQFAKSGNVLCSATTPRRKVAAF